MPKKLVKGSKEAKAWGAKMQAARRNKKKGGSFLDDLTNIGHSLGSSFPVNPFDLGYQGGLALGNQLNKLR